MEYIDQYTVLQTRKLEVYMTSTINLLNNWKVIVNKIDLKLFN